MPSSSGYIRFIGSRWRTLQSALRTAFFSGERLQARLIDDLQAFAAVMLAIGFAHALKVSHVGWAAFSGYMVIRPHFKVSLTRGAMRVLGTMSGALLAYGAVYAIHDQIALICLSLAGVGFITLHAALTRRQSYAWLFTGLTFAMVMLDSLDTPTSRIGEFAWTRVLEVGAGTTAALAIALCAYAVRRLTGTGAMPNLPLTPAAPAHQTQAIQRALLVAIALATMPLFHQLLAPSLLTQAVVTMMAVMSMPATNPNTNVDPLFQRALLRFVGCAAGAALGAIALHLASSNLAILAIFLCAGVCTGRHIENSNGPVAYLGTQFAIVFLVVFVPDNASQMNSASGFERMDGVFLGLVLMQLLRWSWASLSRRWVAHANASS